MRSITPTDITERTYRGRWDPVTEDPVIDVLAGTSPWDRLDSMAYPVLRVLASNAAALGHNKGETPRWGAGGAGSEIAADMILTDALGIDLGRKARLAFSGEVIRLLPIHEPVSWLLSWHLVHRWAQSWHRDNS